MNHLAVRDLVVEFASGDYIVRPLDGLTFEAHDGELVVLLGPSGCGKTTLLSCLAGLLTANSGSIEFQGIDVTALDGTALVRYRRETVGVVFQAFNLIPSLTAKGNVATPMRLAGASRADAGDRATVLLEQVGLADRMNHLPGQLSGGQQQRVAIARALVHDPPLILADEPTAHLDHIQVEGVLRLLRDLAGPGRVVVVSTHDDRVSNLADRVIEMAPKLDTDEEPRVVELADGEVLFEQGSRGSLVYMVDTGLVDILRKHGDGSYELLAVAGVGQYFGELGPILNLPRSATARARGATRVTGHSVREFRARFPGAKTAGTARGPRRGREKLRAAKPSPEPKQ